jgi:putative sterol carrier protein
MKDLLDDAIARFNEKAEKDANFRKELEGVERTVLVDLKGGTTYHFTLRDMRIDGVREGPVEDADITIQSDEETLTAIFRKEMGPMKAYATGRLKIRASLEDVLRLRKFF